MTERRIVLLAVEGAPTNIVYHALTRNFPLAGVILEKPVPRAQFLRNRIKKLGLRVVGGQVLFQAVVATALKKTSHTRIREICAQYGMDATTFSHPHGHAVESANSDEAIRLLKELNPELVIVQGTRILSPKVLAAVKCPFINMHAGITPMFRGVHGGYWALATGQPELSGVTVHLVDRGVDTGGVLEQAGIPITPQDNFVTYPYLQLGVGLALLEKAVRAALAGQLENKQPPPGISRLWTHPTVWEYLYARVTRGIR